MRSLKQKRNELGKLRSWLLKEPVGGVWPTADRCILLILKVFYLGVKLILWIFLGKKRRDQSKLLMKTRNIINISPSLSSLRCLYKSRRILGLSNTTLVKISVPKYGYRVFCPISINKDDFINMTIREDEIIQQFRPRRGDIVVDVGAHMGRYTLIASKLVGSNGRVVSIEANPNNFEMLNNNVKLNQLTNVTSLNCAAYSQETKIKLYLAGEGMGHTIYNTIMAERANEGKERFVEINANTLDHLLQEQEITKVNWIKIDVEGAEYEVLRGATNIISHNNDISLLIEIHNLSGGNMTLYEPIAQFLNKYDFKIAFEKTYDGGEKHLIARKQQY
jgi:FkbM family methyltransferase